MIANNEKKTNKNNKRLGNELVAKLHLRMIDLLNTALAAP